MPLLTAVVGNLTGYDDIVCEFALCDFNLRDQLTKRKCARQKSINFGKHFYTLIYFVLKIKTKKC